MGTPSPAPGLNTAQRESYMAQITRRSYVQAIGACLIGDLLGNWTAAWSQAELSPEQLERYRTEMRRAMEVDAEEVNRLYSTKFVRVFLGSHQYDIPANFLGPKELLEPDRFDAKEYGVGFFLFLPDYGGYSKENWRDPFDRRLITVVRVRTVDKSTIVPYTDGHKEHISPAGYGEPQAQFKNLKGILEDRPSLNQYGLEGYLPKNRSMGVFWTGRRSNGEFFFFNSSLPPGQSQGLGIINPLCDVRYYSAQEDLYVAYRYSQDNIAKWREIDDAIWSKLHQWRVA